MKKLGSLLVIGILISQIASAKIRYRLLSPDKKETVVEVPLSKELDIPLAKSRFHCSVQSMDVSTEAKGQNIALVCKTTHSDGSGGLMTTALICPGDEKKELTVNIASTPKQKREGGIYAITLECY